MIKIGIEGFDRVQKRLGDLAGKARRAAVEAVTKTAQEVKRAERAQIAQVFDRPTPWVLNSVYMKPATRQKPEAVVWIKDEAGKGIPSSKILQAEIDGGSRRQKRSEKALQSIGILPSGWVAVATKHAKTDAFGNMSRGQIVQILSHLQAFGEQGYSANATQKTLAKKWKGNEKKGIAGFGYFAIKPGNRFPKTRHLYPGIYEVRGWAKGARSIKPVMIFTPVANYKVRFKFFDVAQDVADRELTRNFNETLKRYLREDGWM